MTYLAFFLTPLGRWVGGAVAALAVLMVAYYHVKGIGYAECKVEWQRAESEAIKRGRDARTGAERDVDSGVLNGHDRDNP